MDKDKEYTEVVFRKFMGEIIALFPYTFSTNHNIDCESYMKVGQHGAADYLHVIQNSKVPTQEEYQDLFNELESIGYKLKVITRISRNRWRSDYKKHLKKINETK